ncbi:hypothetical protein MOX02_12710 [Methylobacterium oxalidis]|nr:hypothetical protein MOX02_12710 [Methylobacterium oxalidis]GJE30826.1 hypothetical protein LDDCCGHA_0996 [Methylobacterium oxalidis]
MKERPRKRIGGRGAVSVKGMPETEVVRGAAEDPGRPGHGANRDGSLSRDARLPIGIKTESPTRGRRRKLLGFGPIRLKLGEWRGGGNGPAGCVRLPAGEAESGGA